MNADPRGLPVRHMLQKSQNSMGKRSGLHGDASVDTPIGGRFAIMSKPVVIDYQL